MSNNNVVCLEKYYEKAKKMLEKKDLIDFIANISIAIEMSTDEDFLAKATYLKVKGLYEFNQYSKALDYFTESINYNSGEDLERLKKIKGIIQGFLGESKKALDVFKELLHESADYNMLVSLYINIVWILLTVDKENLNTNILDEAKAYLDLAYSHFDTISDERKWRLLVNYSMYYFHTKDFDKAIEISEKAITYCKEENLAEVYTNLAELHLAADEHGVPSQAGEYLDKAEILAERYNDKIAAGNVFFTKALIELREEQLFTALDSLYLAFQYYKYAEAVNYACEVMKKIDELINEFRISFLESIKNSMLSSLRGSKCE